MSSPTSIAFLRDLAAVSHHHDEHFRGTERDELDLFENAVRCHRQRECDQPRCARQHLRDGGQHVLGKGRTARIATKLRFDGGAVAYGARSGQKLIDIETVTAIGWNAAGRRVGLLQVSQVLELGKRVPDGRRRHTQPGHVHQPGRADRLAGIDIFSNECGENLRRSGRKLRHV